MVDSSTAASSQNTVTAPAPCTGAIRAKRWAPVMWFHRSEDYAPMKAEEYLTSVTLRGTHGLVGVDETNLSLWDHESWRKANDNLGELYLVHTKPKPGQGSPGKGGPFDASVYYYYRSTPGDEQYLITYWFFFGYSSAKLGETEHQGDWESMSLLADRKDGGDVLAKAWYTKHGNDEKEEIGKLERLEENGRTDDNRRVYGYFSQNRHAIFREERWGFGFRDSTRRSRSWDTQESLVCLLTRPWKDYRGKWGPIKPAQRDGPYGPAAVKRTRLDRHCSNAQECMCTAK